MKAKNLMTLGAMMAAALSSDPLRRPSFEPQLREFSDKSLSLFGEPKRELRQFSIKGHKVMAYSRKDAITRLKHQKKNESNRIN